MNHHVTKRQATSIATGEDTYLSGVQCACGCGEFLPRKWEAAGRKYLRGHKVRQAGGPSITKFDIAKQGRAPGPTLRSSTNWEGIKAFVLADLQMKQERINLLTAKQLELAAESLKVEEELSKLRREYDDKMGALAILIPETEN